MLVPGEETLLYTATSNFTLYSVEEIVYVDYSELEPNLSVPIQFTIHNTGVNNLSNLTVSLSNGESNTLTEVLKPNESATVTVYHMVGNTVENVGYTIQADNGVYQSGTVYLDYPDIGISRMEVLEEYEGQRTIALTLYNASDATLTGKGRTVKLQLSMDELHTLPADVTCAAQTGVQLSGNVLTISGDEALKRIDQGSLTLMLTFDLGQYVTGTLGQEEIPESGVVLYAQAWAEGKVGTQSEIIRLPEYIQSNNGTSVRMTGALARTGQQLSVNVEQGTGVDGNTTADVILKNNGLQQASMEKLLVALLNAEGYLLEVQEVDTSGIVMAGETEQLTTVEFSQNGSRVIVYPANGQDTLIFDGLPVRMSHFTYDEETDTYVYTLTGVTVRGTLVTAYSADGGAVSIHDTELATGGSQWVSFRSLTDTETVSMGGKTYALTVELDPSMAEDAMWPYITLNPVGATYGLNEQAVPLVVEAESPDGGTLSYQWCITENPYEYEEPEVNALSVLARRAPATLRATWQPL